MSKLLQLSQRDKDHIALLTSKLSAARSELSGGGDSNAQIVEQLRLSKKECHELAQSNATLKRDMSDIADKLAQAISEQQLLRSNCSAAQSSAAASLERACKAEAALQGLTVQVASHDQDRWIAREQQTEQWAQERARLEKAIEQATNDIATLRDQHANVVESLRTERDSTIGTLLTGHDARVRSLEDHLASMAQEVAQSQVKLENAVAEATATATAAATANLTPPANTAAVQEEVLQLRTQVRSLMIDLADASAREETLKERVSSLERELSHRAAQLTQQADQHRTLVQEENRASAAALAETVSTEREKAAEEIRRMQSALKESEAACETARQRLTEIENTAHTQRTSHAAQEEEYNTNMSQLRVDLNDARVALDHLTQTLSITRQDHAAQMRELHEQVTRNMHTMRQEQEDKLKHAAGELALMRSAHANELSQLHDAMTRERLESTKTQKHLEQQAAASRHACELAQRQSFEWRERCSEQTLAHDEERQAINHACQEQIRIAMEESDRDRRALIETHKVAVAQLNSQARHFQDLLTSTEKELSSLQAASSDHDALIRRERVATKRIAILEEDATRSFTEMQVLKRSFEQFECIREELSISVEKLLHFEQSIAPCLSCTACTNLFVDPVTLPCGHTYCRGSHKATQHTQSAHSGTNERAHGVASNELPFRCSPFDLCFALPLPSLPSLAAAVATSISNSNSSSLVPTVSMPPIIASVRR